MSVTVTAQRATPRLPASILAPYASTSRPAATLAVPGIAHITLAAQAGALKLAANAITNAAWKIELAVDADVRFTDADVASALAAVKALELACYTATMDGTEGAATEWHELAERAKVEVWRACGFARSFC